MTPAFDWLPLSRLIYTLEKTLQESVLCYKPQFQVIVFVFLLSKSGSSVAMWRRKLPIPEHLRISHQDRVAGVLQESPHNKVVYVDE